MPDASDDPTSTDGSGTATGAPYDEYRGRPYFPILDGIRAVAVLAVLAFHVGVAHPGILRSLQGYRGVEWFFALSGFLITTLALREEGRQGAMAVRPFFIRRCFRILPLYLVALVAYVIADTVVFHSPGATAGWAAYWPYYVTLLQDIPLNLGWPHAPFIVAWSLGIEEKFYLVWPIVGFVLVGARNRLRLTVATAAVLGTAMLAFRGDGALLVGPYLPILLGCIAAMLLHQRATFEALFRFVRPVTLVLLALAVMAPLPGAARGVRGYLLLYPLLTATTIAAFAAATRVPSLGSAAMQWIGRRSYAVYLFHVLVIRIAEPVVTRTPARGGAAAVLVLLVTLVGSLLLADVLHRLVEQPLIDLGRRLSKVRADAERASSRGSGGEAADADRG